jgi:hypothetical protein
MRFMQVSWRSSEELIVRVQSVAKEKGLSMNEFITQVMDAATNPDLSGDLAVRTRERLERAGLALQRHSPRIRPDDTEVAEAGRAAGAGAAMSDLVGEGRGQR